MTPSRGEYVHPQHLLVRLNIETPGMIEKVELFEMRIKMFFSPEEQNRIMHALNVMVEAHYRQKRTDGSPSIDHPLSVALHIIDLCEKPNVDIVIAALFHDIIEDQTHMFLSLHNIIDTSAHEPQSYALHVMGDTYGEQVAETVHGLTNPDFHAHVQARGMTPEDSGYAEAIRTEYTDHVADAIQDPTVCLIKFVDVTENAGSLIQLPDGERKIWFARKYRPIIDIFISRILDTQLPLNTTRQAEMIAYLEDLAAQIDAYLASIGTVPEMSIA